MTLRNLALPVKVLFTCILLTIGPGYFFAITYLFLMNVQPHVQQGHGVVQAVMEKYYGARETTALEASLEEGGMGEELTLAAKARLLEWIRRGAPEPEFAEVSPIFSNSCAVCHNHEDMPGAPLTTYEEVAAYTVMDTGTSVKTLVRVSHIHVFGMTFLFAIVSGIFVQSEAKRGWRAVIVAIPFMAIWLDIGSWWFTRINPLFAYTVLVGGAVVGLSIAIQIFLSLYEMWLLPPVAPAGYPAMYAGPAGTPTYFPVQTVPGAPPGGAVLAVTPGFGQPAQPPVPQQAEPAAPAPPEAEEPAAEPPAPPVSTVESGDGSEEGV